MNEKERGLKIGLLERYKKTQFPKWDASHEE